MKRITKHLTIVLLSLCAIKANAQAFSIAASTQDLCVNSIGAAALTATVPGAGNYSWTVNGPSASYTAMPGSTAVVMQYWGCGIYTIECTAYTSGWSYISAASTTVSVSCITACVPSVTSNTPFVCAGSPATFSASGCAGTYTWMPGGATGSTATFTPSINNWVYAEGTSTNGCISGNWSQVNVVQYSLNVSGSTQICQGGSTTMSLTSNSPSFAIMPGNINSANPTLSPSVTTTYTIWSPSQFASCAASTVVTVVVNPLPNIAIAPSSPTACSGGGLTLTATGALTYSWSIGANSSSIVTLAGSAPCYSVSGSNASGCTNTAVFCPNILAAPQLSIAGSNSMCLGSSVTLTASGAATYTWNTLPLIISPTINLLPMSMQVTTVTGTALNGCMAQSTFALMPDTSCAIVWPGDANSDGNVDLTDVLEIGLSFGSTGAVRPFANNGFTGQQTPVWAGTGSTGNNRCHIDCDGNGTIGLSDTAAIIQNFAQNHSFRQSAATGNDLLLKMSAVCEEAKWSYMDIELKPTSTNTTNVYGLGFQINYDASKIENGKINIEYPQSFLNTGTVIPFRKVDAGSGACAIVRTDGAGINGSGRFVRILFRPLPGTAGSTLAFTVSQGLKFSPDGSVTNLNPVTGTVIITASSTGLSPLTGETPITVYPNPAKDKVYFRGTDSSAINYTISDMTGRIITAGTVNDSRTVDIHQLQGGTYLVTMEQSGIKQLQRLIKLN